MQFSFTTLQALTLLASTLASAASLQQYSGSFSNPGQIPRVHIYVPDKLASKPAVILGLHPCGGSGDGFHPQLGLAQKADQLGFVMVYPTSKNQGGMNCWDVHSAASLKRDGGGESTSVANLVKEVISKYNADPSKVYVTGFSSGAMMTNNMAAAYPDMFDAAIVTAGVPAACFTGASGSNPTSPDQSCAQAQKNYTPQQWGDLARSMYPGYSGKRPRMMIVHGTGDNVLLPGNYQAELNQWSNVLGVTSSNQTPNTPVQGWTRTRFDGGNKLVGYSIAGGGHNPTYNQGLVLEWFDGLAGGSSGSGPSSSTAGPSTTTPTTTTTSPPFTPTPTQGGPTVNEWGQCGGIGYNGSTQCASGLRCVKSNDWYSQCQK